MNRTFGQQAAAHSGSHRSKIVSRWIGQVPPADADRYDASRRATRRHRTRLEKRRLERLGLLGDR